VIRRLERVRAVVAPADQQTVLEALWSVMWAVRHAAPDDDAEAWAGRIQANHDLGPDGLRRATEMALRRAGMSREDATILATLPLADLIAAAQNAGYGNTGDTASPVE
jgi:hypothetical protein